MCLYIYFKPLGLLFIKKEKENVCVHISICFFLYCIIDLCIGYGYVIYSWLYTIYFWLFLRGLTVI